MVVELWMAGCDIDIVADLDLHGFDTLYSTVFKQKASDQIQRVNLDRAVAHADAKEFSKAIKPLSDICSGPRDPGEELKRLTSRIGGGF